ncbi:hypothetical protein [Paenibacillus rigui]|nr:hypothetical protein [Paenibacillus rigui]
MPQLYFDRNEPFFPVQIGVTFLSEGDTSPSFRRTFDWDDESVATIIEYAIYWDYDIQHMYDLEHVWVYVGRDGQVSDVEASFHGKYVRGLLPGGSNLADGTRVRLYSQPGKHAFLPQPDWFALVPGLFKSCGKHAGRDGLLIGGPFEGVLHTDEETDRIVMRYLQSKAFTPSMEFMPYVKPIEELLVPWEELYETVPRRVKQCLADIRAVNS